MPNYYIIYDNCVKFGIHLFILLFTRKHYLKRKKRDNYTVLDYFNVNSKDLLICIKKFFKYNY